MCPLEAFSPDRHARDGRVSWCRECFASYQRERNRRRREAGIPTDPERDYRTRYAVVANRAQKRDLPFTLTYEQFRALVGQPCHYCGGSVPVIGVDRLDNEEGYTPENTVPACPACNTWKSVMTVDEFVVHVTRLYRRFVLGKQPPGDTSYEAPHLQMRWHGTGARYTFDRRPHRPRRRAS
jgi:hypothetical protein